MFMPEQLKRKKRFICRVCRWKFSASYLPRLCPNCGRTATCEEDTSMGAEDLLKEIEDMEDQIGKRK